MIFVSNFNNNNNNFNFDKDNKKKIVTKMLQGFPEFLNLKMWLEQVSYTRNHYFLFCLQDLVNALKTAKLDGLEINLKKHDSKNDINDFISTIKSKLGSDLYLALSVPPKAETLAKYYDFKALSKSVDLFILQTAFLGASKNVSFHPSRLSGLWDMQNTVSRDIFKILTF